MLNIALHKNVQRRLSALLLVESKRFLFRTYSVSETIACGLSILHCRNGTCDPSAHLR